MFYRITTRTSKTHHALSGFSTSGLQYLFGKNTPYPWPAYSGTAMTIHDLSVFSNIVHHSYSRIRFDNICLSISPISNMITGKSLHYRPLTAVVRARQYDHQLSPTSRLLTHCVGLEVCEICMTHRACLDSREVRSYQKI
jgi:hypothetical protein